MKKHIRILAKRKQMTAEEVRAYYAERINTRDAVVDVRIWSDGKRADIISISPYHTVWYNEFEIVENRLHFLDSNMMKIDRR